MILNKLNAATVSNAKPKGKPYRLYDGGNMYLQINPNGGMWWRLKYSFAGKGKLLSMGTYPDTTLKHARENRDAARKLLASGIDPSQHRKKAKAALLGVTHNSFEVIAREWFLKLKITWTPSYSVTLIRRFERDIFPWIGKRPIEEITAPELLKVLRRIEGRGSIYTAKRALQNCGQLFRYAIATGRAERDLSADLKGAIPPPKRVKHRAATIEPLAIGEILRAFDGYQGTPTVSAALRLAPLVFVRPGELRHAQWDEIDLDAAEWNIPAEKMKMRIAHLVPLSRQAVEIFKEVYLLTYGGRFVFPSTRSLHRPMSDNAILAAMRRMGIAKDEMSGHGFRAMARTLLDETLHIRPDVIEHQLAHAVRDPHGRAYNRTSFLPERRQMMQSWADFLDGLKNGAEVVPIKKATA